MRNLVRISAIYFAFSMLVPVSVSFPEWFEKDIAAKFSGGGNCCDKIRHKSELEGLCQNLADSETSKKFGMVIQAIEVTGITGNCEEKKNPLTGEKVCNGKATGKCRFYLELVGGL